MRSVARRVVDGAVLHLIMMWLEAPVEETDERGDQRRSMRDRDHGRGTPQGAPISPLLSNLYMRRWLRDDEVASMVANETQVLRTRNFPWAKA